MKNKKRSAAKLNMKNPLHGVIEKREKKRARTNKMNRIAESIMTLGGSEVARKLVKSDTGQKIIKGVKSSFKMKGFSGFGNSPAKQTKDGLKDAVKGKGLTAREKRIARNKEFHPIAVKKGLAPKTPKAGDLSPKGRAELKAYEKFYSNKDNIKKLKKAQDEYFKNKK